MRVKANVSPFLSQTRSADQLGNRKYELNDTHVSLIEVNVNIERARMYVYHVYLFYTCVCVYTRRVYTHSYAYRDAYPRVPRTIYPGMADASCIGIGIEH